MEGALVRRAVAEKAQADPAATLQFGPQGRSCSHRDTRTNNACLAEATDAEISKVHRTPLASANASLFAKQLGHESLHIGAFAYGVTMRAVIANHVVIGQQSHTGTHHFGFLSNRRVKRTDDLTLKAHVFCCFVEKSNAQHSSIHFNEEAW